MDDKTFALMIVIIVYVFEILIFLAHFFIIKYILKSLKEKENDYYIYFCKRGFLAVFLLSFVLYTLNAIFTLV